MNDTTQARLDAQLLAELRQWRLSPSVTAATQTKPDAFLSWEEIDMLLRIAEERDALRRQLADMPDERPSRSLHSEPGAECSHEAWERFGLSGRRCADCHLVIE